MKQLARKMNGSCTLWILAMLCCGLASIVPNAAIAAEFSYSILYSFSTSDNRGVSPYGTPTISGSRMYATTSYGGSSGYGTVFSMNLDATDYVTLHHFLGGGDGVSPECPITVVSDYYLWGMTRNAFGSGGTVFSLQINGDNYQVNHVFEVDNHPSGTLLWNGYMYGFSPYGGLNGQGGLFEINSLPGSYTNVYSFTTDGVNLYRPRDTPILANGRLYGVASAGGTYGAGGIFSIGPSGLGMTTLHEFGSTGTDGRFPYGSLLHKNGRLYGFTSSGGAGTSASGTVFSVTTDGQDYQILHTFTGGADGAYPYAGQLVAYRGWLYGMTLMGGSAGAGVVFRVRQDGSAYSIVHTFAGAPDGSGPRGGLCLVGNHLYGMTPSGGDYDQGTIFRIDVSGGNPFLSLLLD